MEGIVEKFSAKRGYGFIETKEQAGIFVHYSGIQGEGYRNLNKGDKVQFDVVTTEKGLQAQNVVVIAPAVPETKKKESEGNKK